MARDEILKMEAGRELDALVAEKIFGFVDLGPLQFAGLRYQKPTTDGVVVLGRLPYYSTDIAAAWQVVEKYRCGFKLEFVDLYRRWYCEFTINENLQSALAETSPHAICRAALLAVTP